MPITLEILPIILSIPQKFHSLFSFQSLLSHLFIWRKYSVFTGVATIEAKEIQVKQVLVLAPILK